MPVLLTHFLLCVYHCLPKERSLALHQACEPILGTRFPWSSPTAGMQVLPGPSIVLSIEPEHKRDVPGSTSSRFAYTGDKASLFSSYCTYASATRSLY
jgi:hypothetical protein